ncbi:MAG: carbonic anhydrase [Candidatus Eremiobacteraeota bacterium]|nr:carbonic anhydrase [Candidatus Eremiobacteraeota bacterium]
MNPDNEHQNITDEYLRHNVEYAKNFTDKFLLPPKQHIAIVACMDSRLDIYAMLGLHPGDAHLIRNAGGVVTDDVMRSLVISQRLLGTKEIVLIHHTDCGMLTFTDDSFAAKLEAETGSTPAYPFHAFPDLDEDVRRGIERIENDPHILYHRVRGFTFDMNTGKLNEVRPHRT